MEITNEKIDFKKIRDFNQLFSSTFAFLRQEFKNLFSTLLIYLSPFLLISAIFSTISQTMITGGSLIESDGMGLYFANMGMYIFVLMITSMMLSVLTYSYIFEYINSDGPVDRKAVFNLAKKIFFPFLGISIVIFILILFGTLLLIIPGIIFFVFTSLSYVVYLFERQNISKSISRSNFLVKEYWWLTFGILFLVYLLISGISYMISVPGMIMTFVGLFMGMEDESNQIISTSLTVVGSIINTFTILISSVFHILITLHYFNLIEKKEAPNLMRKIEAIAHKDNNDMSASGNYIHQGY